MYDRNGLNDKMGPSIEGPPPTSMQATLRPTRSIPFFQLSIRHKTVTAKKEKYNCHRDFEKDGNSPPSLNKRVLSCLTTLIAKPPNPN